MATSSRRGTGGAALGSAGPGSAPVGAARLRSVVVFPAPCPCRSPTCSRREAGWQREGGRRPRCLLSEQRVRVPAAAPSPLQQKRSRGAAQSECGTAARPAPPLPRPAPAAAPPRPRPPPSPSDTLSAPAAPLTCGGSVRQRGALRRRPRGQRRAGSPRPSPGQPRRGHRRCRSRKRSGARPPRPRGKMPSCTRIQPLHLLSQKPCGSSQPVLDVTACSCPGWLLARGQPQCEEILTLLFRELEMLHVGPDLLHTHQPFSKCPWLVPLKSRHCAH
ncbi:uncharacterized protein LOC141728618 [Zonotrichia albicollis]|uniref:uncharacterized protein LOC141728618 n=1 Tax=Zonotrichia albicollis TaxID=44394 RepID=UPI003D80FBE0